MAFKIEEISANDFGNLTIPSITSDYFNVALFERDIWDCYSEGVNKTATCINMISVMIDVFYATEDIGSEPIRVLNGYFDSLEDEDVQEAMQVFSDNVYFIWGSPENGGMYVRRYGEDTCIFGIMQGLYQVPEDSPSVHAGEYFFVFTEDTYNRLRYDEFREIAFTLDEFSILNENPSFFILYRKIGRPIISATFNPTPGISDYVPESTDSSLSDALNDYTYSAFGPNQYPTKIWRAEGYAALAGFNPEGYNKIGDYSWNGNAPGEDDPAGTAGDSGGNGDWSNKTDPVPLPSSSGGVDAINSGLVTLYHTNKNEIAAFAEWLFADITDAEADAMKKLRTSPFDYILFLALCQFPVPEESVGTTIQFVGLDSGVATHRVQEQFIELGDWHWTIGNDTETFLDYNPNCKASIFLPYIGFKDISIDDIRGCSVTLRYNVDLLNGSCIATLHSNRSRRVSGGNADCELDNNIYQWSGNLYTYVPISAADYRSYLQAGISMISAGTSTVLSAASGNVGGVISGMINMAGASLSGKQDVQKSSGSSSSYGIMGDHKPFIMMERPIISEPKRTLNNIRYSYDDEFGRPSNTFRKVSECKGYIEAEFDTLYGNDIYNDNVIASEEEIKEIQELFNNGVYLS